MANCDSSSKALSSATVVGVVPCHRASSWLSKEIEQDPEARSAARLMEIAAGTKVIAQVMRAYAHDLNHIADGTPGVRPLMSADDIDALAGLAAVMLSDLYAEAEARVAFLDQKARKGGQT